MALSDPNFMVLLPILCYDCSRPLSNKQIAFDELINTENTTFIDAMDRLGVSEYCCRKNFISPLMNPFGSTERPLESIIEYKIHPDIDQIWVGSDIMTRAIQNNTSITLPLMDIDLDSDTNTEIDIISPISDESITFIPPSSFEGIGFDLQLDNPEKSSYIPVIQSTIQSQQSPIFTPIPLQQSPIFTPIPLQQSPTFTSIQSQQSPTFTSIQSQQSPTFIPTQSKQLPTFTSIQSQQSPTFTSIQLQQSPTFTSIQSQQSLTFIPTQSKQSPTFTSIQLQQSPTFTSIQSKQSPTFTTIK
uniref:RNA polymerase N 8 kDa subunit n=1 Tax=Pithovirus LCPAC102 TaxID=2506587 RepID=A0A481Z466_9VIRU|nr:MAG: RNA polymerase N 8 kDa subunit [Pithovirus LCPAC102]